jgi:hypothetical protein
MLFFGQLVNIGFVGPGIAAGIEYFIYDKKIHPAGRVWEFRYGRIMSRSDGVAAPIIRDSQ